MNGLRVKTANIVVQSTPLRVATDHGVMSLKKKNLILAVTALSLCSAYVVFRLWPRSTVDQHVDKAIADIEALLSVDQSYTLADRFVTYMMKPSRLDPINFRNNQDQGLKISVRKASRAVPSPPWVGKLNRRIRRLPKYLRLNIRFEPNMGLDIWVKIILLEPSPDELRLFKHKVSSIDLPRNVRIEYSPYFPPRYAPSERKK